MKLPIITFLLLASSPAFAGGGGCSDCYRAYQCTNPAGDISLTIEASNGEFDGAIGEMLYGSQFNHLNMGKGFISGALFHLPFQIDTYFGRPAKFDSFTLLLPNKNWNHVKFAVGTLSNEHRDVILNCTGEGFSPKSSIKSATDL